jgi:hypothetical protein
MEATYSSETSVDFQRPEDRRIRYETKVKIRSEHSEASFNAGNKPLEGGASGGSASSVLHVLNESDQAGCINASAEAKPSSISSYHYNAFNRPRIINYSAFGK